MSVATDIHDTLVDALSPVHLDVINESHQHNVPPGSESHFKVIVVSGAFEDNSLVSRHRSINQLLAAQLAGPVHALSLHTHTAEEWQKKGERVPASPPCRGGGV
jgi:BolA protein